MADDTGVLSQGNSAASAPAFTDLTSAVAKDQWTVNYLSAKLAIDKKAAADAKDAADKLSSQVDAWQETVTVTQLPSIPDASARFVANLAHLPTRDDNLNLSVTNGLLTSGTTTSTDQTPNIIVSLASAVAAFGGGPLGSPPAARFMTAIRPSIPAPQKTCMPYQFSRIFDPTDGTEVTEALTMLAKWKPAVLVDVDGVHCAVGDNPSCTAGKNMTPMSSRKREPGLVYRVPRSVTITAAMPSDFGLPNDNSCVMKTQPTISAAVVVPDSATAFVLPSRAGAFTTATATYGFKDGMPTNYAINQPSEIAAAANIPVAVAKALISVPTELLQLRVNYDTQANALVNARTRQLQDQLQLLKAQQALDQAKAAAAASSGVVQ